MSFWARLGVSVGLFVVAATLNWFALASQGKGPATYGVVVVAEDVQAGEKIGPNNLARVSVPANLKTARWLLVPWDERAVLYDRPINRAMKKGDALLWRDMDPPDAKFDLKKGEVALQLPAAGIAHDARDLAPGQPFGLLLAGPEGEGDGKGRAAASVAGPFRLLRRIDSRDGVMTVAAKRTPDGSWDEQTERLIRALRQGGRVDGVVYYPPGGSGATP